MKKLILLFMLLAAIRSFGAVATNVQHLSQFGKTNRAVAGDLIGLSTRPSTSQERLLGIPITNLVASLNSFGTGTNTVLIAAGTNVVISTNRTGSNVTYTISVTNAFASGADVVWTNNGGLIYPLPLDGQITNSIQIYTNGGLTIGRSTRPYWGLAGFNNETLVSWRNITNDTTDYNEFFVGVQGDTNNAYFDMFFNQGLARHWLQTQVQDGTISRFDQYVDGSSNFVFKAENSSSGDIWSFDPQNASASIAAYYFDTWPVVAQTNRPLFRFDNDSTNKMTLYGNGNAYLARYLGIGTNTPSYPLHIFNSDITAPSIELSYATGAGNTTAFQIRNGVGTTNFQVDVGGLVRSVTVHNSGAITGATATVTALNVTGGTLGAGRILTDVSGTGAATWQTNAAGTGSSGGALTPGVTNVASAADIVIDLSATNTPCISVTNVAAHNISIVVSNPYPGRWFSFYIEGSGLATNNNITWSSVAGLQLKWLDAVTNTLVLSNGFVNVSGWVATMNRNTNMIITYRDE